MADTHHYELVDAIGLAAESVIDGLKKSKKILDPRVNPATRLSRVYGVDVQTRNTQKYRNHRERRMRLEVTVTLRVAWRVNPKDEYLTQHKSFIDEDNVIQAVMTSTDAPFPSVVVKYDRTQRKISPTREWLFADIMFKVEFDRSLVDTVA